MPKLNETFENKTVKFTYVIQYLSDTRSNNSSEKLNIYAVLYV